MAVTIARTDWIDDDGSGTTGTVINNAEKTALYVQIDAALAKLAQLAGGNAFTGNQNITGAVSIAGTLSVTTGNVTVTVNAAGMASVGIANFVAGATNGAQLTIGNDQNGALTALASYSSTYTASGYVLPSSTVLNASGTNGLALSASSAPIRLVTGNLERMRIGTAGEVTVNGIGSLSGGSCQFNVAADAALHNGIAIQNTNGGINTMYYMLFYNGAGGIAGIISQLTASTVAYNTSSDARLKDDAGRATDLSSLRAVAVHDFTWKADGVRDRGIFAQEAHALYPLAVSKGNDDLTESGTLAHPWMTDYSKFVADLIVGWQQHDVELVKLRAALATLKGQH